MFQVNLTSMIYKFVLRMSILTNGFFSKKYERRQKQLAPETSYGLAIS